MKIGLVLEGGGMRSLFTAGVLDVFLDQKIPVNGIVSVSAGALFGVNFPSQQLGRALRYNLQYLNDSRYFGLRHWLKTGNIINKDFAFYELPFSLDPFDQVAFAQSNMDFYATLTNVETGEAEYIKITDVFRQMEVLRATSAMPFVSQLVEIEGNYYLDGGIADSIPVKQAQKLGYDKIIVILTRPLDYRKTRTNPLLFKLFYHKYPKLVERLSNRYQEYNNQVEQVIDLFQQKQIFVIRPEQTLKIGRLEKDPAKLQAMYDLGVASGKQHLLALQQYLRT